MAPPRERVLPRQIDVVGDEHQHAGVHTRLDAASGIREDHQATAERDEQPTAEHDVGDGVTLVEVNAPGQAGHRRLPDVAETEIALVPRDAGGLQVRHRGIRDLHQTAE